MKQKLSALIYPDTVPSPQDIRKLLLFFNSLSYYLPTEQRPDDHAEQNFFGNLYTAYAPAPLFEDLDRFNRLLQELEKSRPDDLSRMFSSAQSPFASGRIKDRDETSSSGVLSALQSENDKIAQIQLKERLWQARLILKLAEILDRREDEIRQGLAKVSTDEDKLLASLEGLNSSQVASASTMDPSTRDTFIGRKNKVAYPENYHISGAATLNPLRVKSWAELFLADSSPERPFLLVTTNQDSGSIILDRYENVLDRQPHKLFTLSIPLLQHQGPGDPSGEDEYLARRNEFRLAVRNSLEYFENILGQTAISGKTPQDGVTAWDDLAEHVAAWEEAISSNFPDSAANLQKLDIYCFPGIPADSLLQQLFNFEPPSAAKEGKYTTCLLAILHP